MLYKGLRETLSLSLICFLIGFEFFLGNYDRLGLCFDVNFTNFTSGSINFKKIN